MNYRIEHDSMGEVRVPENVYWGAQTQRSFENFRIGTEKIPPEVITAFAYLKEAAAVANCRLGVLDEERMNVIRQVCEEIRSGKLDGSFPLAVWQTGSGTQSNMNVNEVIANRGNEIAGKKLLHPNDSCNMSQSSNDTFPTAMHIAAVLEIRDRLLPSIDLLAGTFRSLEEKYHGIVKSGRTHLQDAVPVSFSQEISGWRASLERDREMISASLLPLSELALGATAVGTGLNAPEGFDTESAKVLSELTGCSFRTAENKFHALTAKSELVNAHGALKALAADLMKIANDIRWLASGPRCGLGEMNVFMPVLIFNFLQSVRLLADSLRSFNDNCCVGIEPIREKMHENLHNSLMLVTCLNPYIGYENAAKTVKLAFRENISLKEACVKLGFLTAERFDEVFRPEAMAHEK